MSCTALSISAVPSAPPKNSTSAAVRLCRAAILLGAFALASGVVPQACAQGSAKKAARPAAAATAAPAVDPGWVDAIDKRRQELVAANGPGTDAALRDQLMTMRQQDQTARGVPQGTPGPNQVAPAIATNLAAIDAALTTQLKEIVAQKGWPTIALVGLDASNAAMLILTHTADHAWQLSLLPNLEHLADTSKIDPSSLALVVDKELVAEGKPQRYGSQFKLVNGAMAMYAVEDPGSLDRLRAQVLLPPLEVYKQQLAQMFHMKATNQIVSPAPPAAVAPQQ